MIRSDWQHITNFTKVLAHQVQLYRIDLSSLFETDMENLLPYLNVDEQIRLSRYRFNKDQIRFGVGRFALKQILSHQLDCDPTAITFSLSEYGKPSLANDYKSGLKFNISHSGNLLLLGVGRQHEVGVDTEVYNDTINHLDLAKSVFSQSEQAALQSLPEEKRIDGFYRCWSLKESFIKAVGLGLQIPLDQFSMRLNGNDNLNCLISSEWNPSLMNTLISKKISVDSNHSGAYTCNKSITEVGYYDLTEYTIQHCLTQHIKH